MVELATICAVCGIEIEQPKTGRKRLTCSRECRDRKALPNKRKPKLVKSCVVCSSLFETSRDSQVCCSSVCRAERLREVSRARYWDDVPELNSVVTIVCSWCGNDLEVERNPETKRFGANRMHDDCRVQAKRARYRIKAVKRQGLVTRNLITHEEIAERDNYICHICGELVDMSLSRVSRMGATLDHVWPISKGGEDSVDNLKLAHWICNVRKRDKV